MFVQVIIGINLREWVFQRLQFQFFEELTHPSQFQIEREKPKQVFKLSLNMKKVSIGSVGRSFLKSLFPHSRKLIKESSELWKKGHYESMLLSTKKAKTVGKNAAAKILKMLTLLSGREKFWNTQCKQAWSSWTTAWKYLNTDVHR